MSIWVLVNISLALAYIFFRSISYLLGEDFRWQSKAQLVFVWALCISLSIGLSMELPLSTESLVSRPMQSTPVVESYTSNQQPISFQPELKENSVTEIWYIPNFEHVLWLGIFSIGLLFWLFRSAVEFIRIREVVSSSIVIKRIGNVRVLVSSGFTSAFSFFFGKSYIIIPEEIYLNPQKRLMCLSHEIQHHKNFDTFSVYFTELFKATFFLNPFVHLWIKEWNLLVEMNCDKDVLTRKSFNIKQYAYLLIESARESKQSPQATLAMASYQNLSRRIEMITTKEKAAISKLNYIALLACAIFVWAGSSFANEKMKPGEMTKEELQAVVNEIQTDFPIVVNEKVLKWVNYFVADKKGRAYYIQAKANMKAYKARLKEVLEESKMPEELLGVPFIESAYSNEAVSPSMRAKGIWQFIKPTAQRFGLTVNQTLDERLDVVKASKAAMNYYKHLLSKEELQEEWNLALLAYNSGESNLIKEMQRRNTRDPWSLKVGDKDYLAKIHAGIILVSSKRDLLFQHPVARARTTSGFGYRHLKTGKKSFHKGLDLAIRTGEAIKNPLSGRVIEVTEHFNGKKSYGKTILVDHGENIISRFSHLDSFLVKKGQRLVKGEVIGTVGETGYTTGPHLHYELLVNGKHVDPALYF